MGLFDSTPDPSAYGAALSQPGYGYGSPLLLPQVAAAYQNDPRTALVRELMRQNSEGLKSFMPSGKAVAGHVLASGFGALAAALQGQRYQEINDSTSQSMRDAALSVMGPVPGAGATNADGSPKTDQFALSRALLGSQAMLPSVVSNLQQWQMKNQEAEIAKNLKFAEQHIKPTATGGIAPLPGAIDTESALSGAKAGGARTAENTADTTPTNIAGQAALQGAKTGAATTADLNAQTALKPGLITATAGPEAAAAALKETAINPALTQRAGAVTTATKKAELPFETVGGPDGTVMPKTAIVGGGAPRAQIAPGVPLPPPPSAPSVNIGTPTAQGAPTSQAPTSGSSGPTSRSTTPPPPVNPAAIGAPAPSPGAPAPTPGTGPVTFQKLPGGGNIAYGNTAGEKLATTSAELDAKSVNDARADSQASVKAAQSAQMIKDFMPGVKMGWNGVRQTEAGEILKTLGVPDSSIAGLLHTNVADAQVLNSKFLDLAVSGIKGSGIQRPGSVLPVFLDRWPGLRTEPDAATMLANATIMDSKYKNDYADGMDTRRQQSMVGAQQAGVPYKGLTGFESDFRTSNPPLYYVHAAEAMSGKDVGWKQITDDAQRARVIGLMPQGTHFLLPQPIKGPNGETISWGIKQ